jgi:hypothetical protein
MRISQGFLVAAEYPLFLQKSNKFLVLKNESSTLFFSSNFDVFHGAENHVQSMACDGAMRGAREKRPVSTVSLCIKKQTYPGTRSHRIDDAVSPLHEELPKIRGSDNCVGSQDPGVSPTKVRKVPQDFAQLPGRKGFSATSKLPRRNLV